LALPETPVRVVRYLPIRHPSRRQGRHHLVGQELQQRPAPLDSWLHAADRVRAPLPSHPAASRI